MMGVPLILRQCVHHAPSLASMNHSLLVITLLFEVVIRGNLEFDVEMHQLTC